MMQVLCNPASKYSFKVEGESASSAELKPVFCFFDNKDVYKSVAQNDSPHSYYKAEGVKLIVSFVIGASNNDSSPDYDLGWVEEAKHLRKKTHQGFFERLNSASDVKSAKNAYKCKARYLLAQVNHLQDINEREASRFVMKEIEKNIKKRQLMFLNEILDNVELYDLKPRALVSTLRSTYRAKDLLPKWELVLNYTESQLASSGLDVDAWLMGLNNGR